MNKKQGKLRKTTACRYIEMKTINLIDYRTLKMNYCTYMCTHTTNTLYTSTIIYQLHDMCISNIMKQTDMMHNEKKVLLGKNWQVNR